VLESSPLVTPSKTGCRRFEPCRPCQSFQGLISWRFRTDIERGSWPDPTWTQSSKGTGMYDVFLSPKGVRLIVEARKPAPAQAQDWKKARTVADVSQDTKDAIETVGYHLYKLTTHFDEIGK
jgi:hypothetical protein